MQSSAISIALCLLLLSCSADANTSDAPLPPPTRTDSPAAHEQGQADGAGAATIRPTPMMAMPSGMMQTSKPASPAQSQGAAGSASVRTVSSAGSGAIPRGTPTSTQGTRGCSGGYYEGTYKCVVDFAGLGQLDNEGQTAFTLEINKMAVDKGLCQEFCPNLVIAKGTGTLFGLAGPYAFQSQLDGGLDCQTGEFRANIKEGVYGFPGPSDPSDEKSKLAVVFEMGTFGGMLKGMHGSGPPELIDGNWALAETVTSVSCTGPFSVQLQP